MAIADFVNKLPAAFRAEDAEGVSCTLQFNLSEPMYVVIENGRCTAHSGTAESPDLSMQIADEDFIELFTGKIDGIGAYMSGKLALEGDLMLAQRIGSFFETEKMASDA